MALLWGPQTAEPFLLCALARKRLCETPVWAFMQVFPAVGERNEQRVREKIKGGNGDYKECQVCLAGSFF